MADTNKKAGFTNRNCIKGRKLYRIDIKKTKKLLNQKKV